MKIINQQGNPVEPGDPLRAIWYSASCGYWTDDWDLLQKVGPGIPVCPTCGGPGFITTATLWDKGVVGHDSQVPGYKAFIESTKNTCLGKRGGLANAWTRYQQGLQ